MCAQVGSFGAKGVPILESSDVTKPYVHIPGHGYLDLIDTANMSKPTYIVHTSAGAKAVGDSPMNEIDYFNDGDLAEYSYKGDTADWSFTNDSFSGAKAFRLTGGTSSSTHVSANSGGLKNYPTVGKKWQVWVKIHDTSQDFLLRFYWMGSDGDHVYESVISDGCFFFRNRDSNISGGSAVPDGKTFVNYNDKQWYRFEHILTDNGDGTDDLEIRLYDAKGNFIDNNHEPTVDHQQRGDWWQIYWAGDFTVDQAGME